MLFSPPLKDMDQLGGLVGDWLLLDRPYLPSDKLPTKRF